MVCVPCIFIPLILYIFHKFIRPYLMPWLEKMGIVKAPEDDSKRADYKQVCEGGVCKLVRTDCSDSKNATEDGKEANEESNIKATSEVEATGDAKKDQ